MPWYSLTYPCGRSSSPGCGCASLIGLGFGGAASLCALFLGLAADANAETVAIATVVSGLAIGFLFYYYEKKKADIHHYWECADCHQHISDPAQAYLYRVLRYIVNCGSQT